MQILAATSNVNKLAELRSVAEEFAIDLISPIDLAREHGLGAVPDVDEDGVTYRENAIKKALWNTLGPDGVNLLVDYETGEALDPEAGYSQLDVTLDCDTGLIVNIRLAASLALLDTTQNPIDFAIGVPGFGLEVDGNVVVSIGFDLKFGFGFNTEDGFYFNSSAPADDPQ